jgi:hypothetical protein
MVANVITLPMRTSGFQKALQAVAALTPFSGRALAEIIDAWQRDGLLTPGERDALHAFYSGDLCN